MLKPISNIVFSLLSLDLLLHLLSKFALLTGGTTRYKHTTPISSRLALSTVTTGLLSLGDVNHLGPDSLDRFTLVIFCSILFPIDGLVPLEAALDTFKTA
jgi:hypothetical protein